MRRPSTDRHPRSVAVAVAVAKSRPTAKRPQHRAPARTLTRPRVRRHLPMASPPLSCRRLRRIVRVLPDRSPKAIARDDSGRRGMRRADSLPRADPTPPIHAQGAEVHDPMSEANEGRIRMANIVARDRAPSGVARGHTAVQDPSVAARTSAIAAIRVQRIAERPAVTIVRAMAFATAHGAVDRGIDHATLVVAVADHGIAIKSASIRGRVRPVRCARACSLICSTAIVSRMSATRRSRAASPAATTRGRGHAKHEPRLACVAATRPHLADSVRVASRKNATRAIWRFHVA